MKNLLVLGIAFASIGLVLHGCSGSSDEGSGVPETVTNELSSLSDAAKKAGGDFTKLSPEDRQKFIQRTGSEEGAKAMVTRMATPPPNMGGSK